MASLLDLLSNSRVHWPIVGLLQLSRFNDMHLQAAFQRLLFFTFVCPGTLCACSLRAYMGSAGSLCAAACTLAHSGVFLDRVNEEWATSGPMLADLDHLRPRGSVMQTSVENCSMDASKSM